MFKRKIYDEINKWHESLKIKRRALVVKGLRQVGKTTAVLEYCKKNYKYVAYINFMDKKSLKTIFDKDLDVNDIIRDLSAALPGVKFIPNQTVIVFDEIQECSNARYSFKPLMLDGRFDVIATGSLIGLRGYNRKQSQSIPTGFEYSIRMYPMDFEEFLWAKNVDENLISYVKECYKNKEVISDIVNNQFNKYFKEYLCVGGMPDAVKAFLITNDLNQVYDVLKGILESYRDDFGKHLNEQENPFVNQKELTRIMEVYNSIPAQLAKANKKFQYSQVAKGAKGREYKFAITWLEEFGLINLCYDLTTPQEPLEGFKKDDVFKVYVSDTGLFIAMLGVETYNEILNEDMKIYKGAIYENIVADAQIKNGKKLYYFSKDSGMEIDFIAKVDNKLQAIEVKARNNNAKSLNSVISNKNNSIESGIKLVEGNIGYSNNVYTIPQYLSFLLV